MNHGAIEHGVVDEEPSVSGGPLQRRCPRLVASTLSTCTRCCSKASSRVYMRRRTFGEPARITPGVHEGPLDLCMEQRKERAWKSRAEVLEQHAERAKNPYYTYADQQGNKITITKKMYMQYGKPFNKLIWSPDYDAKKPRVQIQLPFEPGQDAMTDELLTLILDKTIDIVPEFVIDSMEQLGALDLNDIPQVAAVWIQAFRSWLHSVSEADSEQVNKAMLSFLAHVLAVCEQKPPRQLCPQIDHPSINHACMNLLNGEQGTEDPTAQNG